MKFAKKTDMIALAVLLLLGALAFFIYRQASAGKAVKAEIYLGAQLVQTVALNTGEDRTFSVPQNEQVKFHLYSDGSIAFESSDCPDKVCVRAGRQKLAGASAACLPNQLILKIVPSGERAKSDLDLIAG